nr:MAG TPA: hypothetical protein [Caudoviricetes sp.]
MWTSYIVFIYLKLINFIYVDNTTKIIVKIFLLHLQIN